MEKNIKRLGNIGINISYVVKKSLFKKKLKGGSCQEKINNEIDGKYGWLQIEKILQSLQGKGITTIQATIKNLNSKEVVIKIQEREKAINEYNIQYKIRDFNGIVNFECIFFCDGDKEYIESFATLKEYGTLCKSKGINMGIILMEYYKNGSLEDIKDLDKNIIEKLLKNYLEIYIKTGFIHGDFYPKNVILDDDYNPIIIDFEKSYFNDNKENHTLFWADLTTFFTSLKYSTNLSNFIRTHCMTNGAYNKKPSIDLINKLLKDL